MQLQASDRGTRGLGELVGEGQPRWENGVVGKLATRHPCANAWWQLPIEEHARAGAWLTVSCRGLSRRVDWGEPILMVGLPAGGEIARKSC